MAQHDGKILMIDDEQDLLKLSSSILRREGFAVETRSDAREALALLQEESFDIILLDLHMPEMSGLEFLRQLNVRERPEEVLILTAYADLQSAVETVKLGAYGYLAKPFNAEEILSHISNIRELQKLRSENERLRQAQGTGLGMVGETEQMRQIYRLVQDVAPTPLPVLICGESGTGKELVAAAIHRASDRAAGPFVRCNCAALNPGVLESELFGHVKGSFTGAVRDRKGRFMEADGGTLFLDEIGDLDVGLQTRLLRVLQEGEFELVGSTETHKVDVRVLSATNRNLTQAVAEGQFREDLFYRLNAVTIEVPPLRQRKADIPLFCHFFIDRLNDRFDKQIQGVSKEALEYLEAYGWPGNVREMENAIMRALALAKGREIEVEDLPTTIVENTGRQDEPAAAEEAKATDRPDSLFHEARQRFEEQFIRDALEKTGGNISHAAQQIQLGRRNLQRKIKQFGIDVSQYSRRP